MLPEGRGDTLWCLAHCSVSLKCVPFPKTREKPAVTRASGRLSTREGKVDRRKGLR